MELLRFLISFLSNDDNLQALTPVFNAIRSGNFNLERLLSALPLDKLLPLINSFTESLNSKSPTDSVGQSWGLSPVSSIADKDIIFALNKYFGSADNYS